MQKSRKIVKRKSKILLFFSEKYISNVKIISKVDTVELTFQILETKVVKWEPIVDSSI